MLCEFVDGVCQACRTKRSPPYPRRRCTAGLGDRIARRLSSFGITKERAQAVANAIGVEDCGCERRRQRLNELGRMVGIGGPPPAEAENQGGG
jgi:hypothetical protein